MTSKNEGTKTVVQGRLSYVHVFKPYAGIAGQEEKYSTTILIPKKDTNTKASIDAAIAEAERKGIAAKWDGVKPPVVPNPLWDGDGVKSDGSEFGVECKGHWVLTASAKSDYPPQVVNQRVEPIMNQSEMYSGVWANVAINFFPYKYAGKKGIGAGLGNIQKVKDGESLAGTRTAQQDFKPVASAEDEDFM